jgi:gliding motility-associated-like protein
MFGLSDDPPNITCVEVMDDGSVKLYWISHTTNWSEFDIYFSTNKKNNWKWLGSIDVPNSNFSITHDTAHADIETYYYVVTAKYAGVGDVPSDTVNTIFIGVTPANNDEGVALILWNPVSDPLPEGSSEYYKIYKSIQLPGDPYNWVLLDSTKNTLYNDTLENGLCDVFINYKIVIDNTNSCSSNSNVKGDWFSETRQPEKPVFDSVSTTGDGNVILGWTPSVSIDALGTIIYIFDSNGIPLEIDTITNNQISTYIDSIRKPCENRDIRYSIAAIDSCGNKSPATFSSPLRPIYLNEVFHTVCMATNSISWDSYINAEPEIVKYEIWASENSSPFILVGKVNGNVTSYDHTDVKHVTVYDYFIRAIFGNNSSTSCTQFITTGNYVKPNYIYLANADVRNDNYIDINMNLDLVPNSCTWEIYRSDVGGGTQSLLTTINRNDVNSSPFIYEDLSADGSTGLYIYSIDVFDSCGQQVLQSDSMKTVYLEGIKISENIHQLSWNAFEGYENGVSKYYIFRHTNDIINPLPYASVITTANPTTYSYTDDVSMISTTESKFTYKVQAVESGINSFGHLEKSNSNTVDFFRDTELYMPNAFRPQGINKIFKPVTTGFAGSNYLFQIYSRWGQIIFETNNPDEGWNGNHNGNMSPQGTYIFRLVYENVLGEPVGMKGSVTLIH